MRPYSKFSGDNPWSSGLNPSTTTFTAITSCVSTSSSETYTYDADGNQTARVIGGQIYTLGYNAESRLVSVTGPSLTASFVYDGDGARVKSVINGVTTSFVGSHYEKSGSTVTKYYFAGTSRIAMRKGGTLSYLLTDHLGSTSITTNSAGALVSELRYKPWGETRYSNGTTPTKYTYTGQYSNVSDFGLMFYNARWYDPALGRFAQADSIVPGGVQGYDRYAYVSNNPIRYNDPSGHCPEEMASCRKILQDRMADAYDWKRDNSSKILESAKNIKLENGMHYTLGTIINMNTVLTHNHFLEPLWRMNVEGQVIAYSDPIGPGGINSGQTSQTRLLTFKSDISGTPAQLAPLSVILSLNADSIVQVIYWDDANSEMTIGQFGVRTPASSGIIILDDPIDFINPGDSGGGVFYDNMLIGNLWAENAGIAIVAILPSNSYLTNTSTATTPIPLK